MKGLRNKTGAAHQRRRRSGSRTVAVLLALALVAPTAWADNGVNIVLARKALLAELQSKGLAPAGEAGLDLEDYIDADRITYDGESAASALLTLRFGPDGHMLPSKRWMSRHAGYCDSRDRESLKPSRSVTVKIIRTSETAPIESIAGMDGKDKLVTRYNYSVHARENDIVDGKLHIRAAHDVESTIAYTRGVGKPKGNNPDTSELDGLVRESLAGLGARLGSPTGPCGDEVEEPEDSGAIQPLDGTWIVTMKSIDTASCSPMIAKQLRPAVESQIGSHGSQDLKFDKPFHPRPLMQKGPDLDWDRTGLNSWHALQAESGSTSLTFDVNLDIEVMSPTHIAGVQKQHVRAPAKLKQLMGDRFDCDVTALFDYRRVEQPE